MLEVLMRVFAWLIQLYAGLPDEAKEKIKEGAVDAFGDFFQRFYRNAHDEAAGS